MPAMLAELAGFVSPWWLGLASSGTVSTPGCAVMAAWALAVIVALLIDRVLGEPPAWVHPVVAMGKALEAAGRRIGAKHETDTDLPRFVAGTVAWCGLGTIVVLVYAVPH